VNTFSHPRPFLTNGVVAHRGAWRHGRGAQNSMTAFRDAIKKGFACFECDVNLSIDEQLVVAHGPRATDDKRSPIIAATRYRDLQRVPLGNGDHPPLLSEVLEEVMGQDRTGVILDIKPTPGGSKNDLLATQIAATVRDMAAQAWVSYIGESYDMLLQIIDEDASARCSPLEHDRPIATYLADGMWGVDFKHSKHFHQASDVRAFQEAGLKVNTWTPNDPRRLKALHAWGIDLITTDEPEKLLAIREQAAPG
jgi:glycerophosphoryl diester phosphodiesterase